MSEDLKIAVAGAAGRMGRALIAQIAATDGCTLAGAFEHEGHGALGSDAGVLAGLPALNIPLTDDVGQVLSKADAVLDFTVPASTVALAGLAAEKGVIHVIGTTGLDDAQEVAIAEAADKTAIVKSGNMSLGVNLVAQLVRQVSSILDEDWDIEIVEMHHRHKVDAPSGTALMFGRSAAEGRGVDLATHSDRGRAGQTGARKRGDIGFAALRGGSVVGDHSVIFAADKERVTLTHQAEDRAIFARGAVKAALWAKGRAPGLYSMADVLGF